MKKNVNLQDGDKLVNEEQKYNYLYTFFFPKRGL